VTRLWLKVWRLSRKKWMLIEFLSDRLHTPVLSKLFWTLIRGNSLASRRNTSCLTHPLNRKTTKVMTPVSALASLERTKQISCRNWTSLISLTHSYSKVSPKSILIEGQELPDTTRTEVIWELRAPLWT
jgi:hypothetical protein